jgi:hypothetical protein
MVTILGIRHHGVGAAHQLQRRLHQIKPDLILVEGPAEADPLLPLVGDARLQPPVALLCYDESRPSRSTFYPFTAFSPEWQAMLYANDQRIPVRMIDLPQALRWAMDDEPADVAADHKTDYPDQPRDPLSYLARIAGFADSEMWWEQQFEQAFGRHTPEDHFEAVMLVMDTLRTSGVPSAFDAENALREAWMAQTIRKAQREMYQNIVVVCGAWHAPALVDLDKTQKNHEKLLKKLPKSRIKVGLTWIPWTNSRLSFLSGYGAGIYSPGWYGHLWENPDDRGDRWLSKVARLFRDKKMDISTAHVIEAARLAASLAGLRERPRPGLQEMNEATTTVMCMGDTILLDLVRRELIVGNQIGQVPPDLPKLPLQADVEEQARKLRMPQTDFEKEWKLDLRNELDLNRSIFLTRLNILGVHWATQEKYQGRGTFVEVWRVKWTPEMLVALIEQGIWGNTLYEAAGRYLAEEASHTASVDKLAGMIAKAIPAALYAALESIVDKMQSAAAVSADIAEMMRAVLPLADLGRYGNVRQLDQKAVEGLLEGLFTRISIGLPNACYGLDDDSAQHMFDLIRQVNSAVNTLDHEAWTAVWINALLQVSNKDGVSPVLSGCTCRLLLDARVLERGEAARRFAYFMSTGQESEQSAAWLEGFLKGSGMILLYDDVLWNLLYKWVAELPLEAFQHLLPILRRTFAAFIPAERKSLGEKARAGAVLGAEKDNSFESENHFDHALAEAALYLTIRILNPAIA